ncbi:hypothetical protein DS745_07360 [Anaerobacillus alkaliphilus]|uniref:Uncharacterized protein n=1 Tax=Anaerobacillus alkaliphilus TaxID=1548597 RepID=A0A4Q0VU42_9BACI|nr:hypothetical protein [Anaerobacillus alkaliphilus]RXJ02201.1 hypothetical protein DS745_07360 [Anaerobacillus alkaliphilus]
METTLLELLTSGAYTKVIKTGKCQATIMVDIIKDETLELFDSVVPSTKAVVDYEDVYLVIPSDNSTSCFSDQSMIIEINPVILTCSNASDVKVFKVSARVEK